MMMFEKQKPSRFGILPRHGDNASIRWFEAESCYVFHTLNAYEQGDEVILIACRMSSTSILGVIEKVDPEADIPRLYRWCFNMRTGEVREELLDDRVAEFPRINENYTGQKNRYGYTGTMSSDRAPFFTGVIKSDFEGGSSQIHEFGQGRFGGEAVFAPRDRANQEDDGWLITFVYDANHNTSELVVIDAQHLDAQPVARVMIPQRVPYGFHGAWISD